MKMISIREACKLYKIPEKWLRAKVRDGAVTHYRSGKKFLLTDEGIENFLKNNIQNEKRV